MGKTDRPHLPGSLTHSGTDRPPHDVIQTLYESAMAVYFDGGWFEAYVSAPVADRFTLRYNNEHDHGADWERTQIHPAALKRELRERDWQLVAAIQVPRTETSHAD